MVVHSGSGESDYETEMKINFLKIGESTTTNSPR